MTFKLYDDVLSYFNLVFRMVNVGYSISKVKRTMDIQVKIDFYQVANNFNLNSEVRDWAKKKD